MTSAQARTLCGPSGPPTRLSNSAKAATCAHPRSRSRSRSMSCGIRCPVSAAACAAAARAAASLGPPHRIAAPRMPRWRFVCGMPCATPYGAGGGAMWQAARTPRIANGVLRRRLSTGSCGGGTTAGAAADSSAIAAHRCGRSCRSSATPARSDCVQTAMSLSRTNDPSFWTLLPISSRAVLWDAGGIPCVRLDRPLNARVDRDCAMPMT